MKKILALFAALIMVSVSSIAFAATDISSGKIRAEGIGGANQSAPMGIRAAKVDAMRNLLEEINGVQVDATTTVENFITTSDVIKTKVNGMIKGAKIVESFKDNMGNYHIVMEVPVYGVGGLADAVVPAVEQVALPEPDIFQPAPLPNRNPVGNNANTGFMPPKPAANGYGVPSSAKGNYTGLIVDCSGMGLQTAMAPGIYTPDRRAVYGLEHFSHDQVISRGYVGYSNGWNRVTRAGSNPMVIKAIDLADNNVRPVISNADAARVLSENKVSGFLSAGNVVFIK